MLMPLLRLLRLPALFTTFPDVLAGYAVAHQTFATLDSPGPLLWLLVASAGLYLSGMVWNDVFDVAQDREERPGRPIPSGQISRRTATLIAAGLMLGGIAAAALASVTALLVALLLAGLILAYDAGGKRTVFGPVLMGACRSANFLLGTTVLPPGTDVPAIAYGLAGLIGLYVVGVTLFARSEAVESSRGPLWLGTGLIFGSLLGWGALAVIAAVDNGARIAIPILLLITWQLSRRLRPALQSGAPAAVQLGVRSLLLTIPMLEALVIVAHGHPAALPLAIAAALMMVPGQILARFIPMT